MKNMDLNIQCIEPLLNPQMVKHEFACNSTIQQHVENSRIDITNIIKGHDKRLFAVIGPCSIHDPLAALEYANSLSELAKKYCEKILVAMRVYFEKPRTTTGWKGFINDPNLDESFDINSGLIKARELLLEINKIGLPVATEFVDTITPQYLSDCVSWAAIGARTTESQAHRMLASGLSMPVGFKNNTAGDIDSAINAVVAARGENRFLGINEEGLAAIVVTKGNPNCHVVLRGGINRPNYYSEDVLRASINLAQLQLSPTVMIDCSHDNSAKDYRLQSKVINNVCEQLKKHNHIMGIMLESNIHSGRQNLQIDKPLKYGQSITDGCISLEETKQILAQLAEAI